MCAHVSACAVLCHVLSGQSLPIDASDSRTANVVCLALYRRHTSLIDKSLLCLEEPVVTYSS